MASAAHQTLLLQGLEMSGGRHFWSNQADHSQIPDGGVMLTQQQFKDHHGLAASVFLFQPALLFHVKNQEGVLKK
jgi:hypothetical protein